MKKIRKILSEVLVLCMVICMMPVTIFGISTNGSCGEHLTWQLSGNTLTISGSGEMEDYSSNLPPWNYNSNVQSVVIQEGVTSIGSGAFYYLENLTDITIANSVSKIGDSCWIGCRSLKNITVNASNEYFTVEDGVLFNRSKTDLICYPSGSERESYSIPEGVLTIKERAFYRCENLKSLNISSSVSLIEPLAFGLNFVLSEISTDINNEHFTSEDGVLFSKNKNQLIVYPGSKVGESYNIPQNVKSIESEAFSLCKNLKNVMIPNGVTNIKSGAFDNSYVLISVTIPDSVTSIEHSAFVGCDALKNIQLPPNITSITHDTFTNCESLEEIVIPEGVENIDNRAFMNCQSLKRVSIPVSVTSIGNQVFDGCSALQRIDYAGTSEDWEKISIGNNNSVLNSTTIHYNGIPHNFSSTWEKDDTYHWHVCTDNDCNAVSGRAEHSWDAGTITTAPTESTAGVKTFTCTVCQHVKTETVSPIVPGHVHNWSNEWNSNSAYHWHNCTASDCNIADNSQKDGYGEHVYDNEADNICNTCGYNRTVTTPATEFTITFNANGGTVDTASAITGADGKLTSLPAPSRSNYTFNGWYTAASGGTQITVNTVFDRDITVYAQWSENTNNGGGSSSSGGGGGGGSSGNSGSSVTIPVSGGSSSVNINAKVSGSTATIDNIKTSEIDKISSSEKESMVEIDSTALNKDIDTVKMKSDSIKTIAKAAASENSKVAGLSVKFDNCIVEFNSEALNAISNQAGSNDIQLKVENISTDKLNTAQKEAVKDMNIQNGYNITLTGGKSISDFNNGSVTVKIPFDIPSGKSAQDFCIIHIADDGTVAKMPTSYENGYLKFTTDHFSNYLISYSENSTDNKPSEPLNWTNPYSDVVANAWYFDAVKYVSENGLMNGTSVNTFAPNSNLSRAMLAQILYNKEGEPTAGASAFTDVPSGKWFTDAVSWAAAQGVVNGLGNNIFGPNNNITHEQLAVMLFRYAKSPETAGSVTGFSDASQISGYAADAMAWATSKGIMNGKGDGRLDPKGLATRAEVAQMIKNYIG